MSIERVKQYLVDRGFGDRVREFDVSSATVELAAQAVGCEGARIAKTLSFVDGDACVLVVTAGDMRVDNAKFKAQFGFKAKMLTPDQAIERTGHAVGGVCPFALNDGVRVFLDRSMQRFDEIYPAAGNAASAVALTPTELQSLTNGIWADLCKDWETQK